MMAAQGRDLGWFGIVRIGLVQASIGAVVILATSTLNRVMVVEASLPAIVPGLLVGLHYAIQVMRPRLGYGSDLGRRRTPWILGGMAVLGLGTTTAALAVAMMAAQPMAGIVLAVVAYLMIGLGVGSAGTSLLVLLASSVDDRRRAAAATIVWIMMIAGFVISAGTAGHLLDPYSPARLVEVIGGASVLAILVSAAALLGLERLGGPAPAPSDREAVPFRQALAEVWSEPRSRRFALFVFVSMLAYSAQNLILEPFAGSVFGLAPGATTQLAGVQHAGLLTGMLLIAVAGTVFSGGALGSMRIWTAVGCLASALGVVALAAAAAIGPPWPLRETVFLSGLANGTFAIAAITAMMQLVSAGRTAREGVRMGMWGGAQAVAFGLGGFSGAALSDLGRFLTGSNSAAYAAVFLIQAVLFMCAASLSVGVFGQDRSPASGDRIMPLGAVGPAGA